GFLADWTSTHGPKVAVATILLPGARVAITRDDGSGAWNKRTSPVAVETFGATTSSPANGRGPQLTMSAAIATRHSRPTNIVDISAVLASLAAISGIKTELRV